MLRICAVMMVAKVAVLAGADLPSAILYGLMAIVAVQILHLRRVRRRGW